MLECDAADVEDWGSGDSVDRSFSSAFASEVEADGSVCCSPSSGSEGVFSGAGEGCFEEGDAEGEAGADMVVAVKD